MLLRLAMRNVFRARARSAITIGALFFGVVMSLLLSALVMGVGESLVAEAIESRVGAIQVHKKGYFEKRDRQPLVFHIDRDPALEQKLLGDKTGSGFYKKSKGDGGKEILVLDLKTFEYRAQNKVRFDSLGAARDAETLDEKIRAVLGGTDKAAKFAEQVTLDTLAYAARLMGEIADDVVNVDRAMRWGFAWEQGPFQTWDAYGVEKGVTRMHELGIPVAPWVQTMLDSGRKSFHGADRQFDTFWNIGSKSVNYVPQIARQITVDALERSNKRIKGNDSASLFDMGDGARL
jgi:3-hydroxyacyl-CoA dehydrogenase